MNWRSKYTHDNKHTRQTSKFIEIAKHKAGHWPGVDAPALIAHYTQRAHISDFSKFFRLLTVICFHSARHYLRTHRTLITLPEHSAAVLTCWWSNVRQQWEDREKMGLPVQQGQGQGQSHPCQQDGQQGRRFNAVRISFNCLSLSYRSKEPIGPLEETLLGRSNSVQYRERLASLLMDSTRTH